MNKKILIIDDDNKLNKLLIDYFLQFKLESKAFTHPKDGLSFLEKENVDIIILDIMLPEMDGFEVCKKIREKFTTPIIMLTARGEVSDRIVGLELGADDYIPKPFEPRELVARIQTVLRRSSSQHNKNIKIFNEIEINYLKYEVKVAGELIDITTMEFEILALLTKKNGHVITRDEIFEKIKGLDSNTYDRSIDVMVSRLRSKLKDDPRYPKYIKTVRGAGYKFIGSE